MPNDPSSQPTLPLTDAELETIRKDVESNTPAYASVTRAILFHEVVRLRAENTTQAERLAEAQMEHVKQVSPIADELQNLKDYVWGHAEGGTFPSEILLDALLERVTAAHVRALGLDQDGNGQA